MGSVKDRLALGVIEAAERDGRAAPGQTVIEATSGNTGIGLAMVCAQKGYPLVVVMAENFSVERRRLMRFLGAKVVLTPAAEKGSRHAGQGDELAEKHGWFLCRQFENEANADIHSRTTAQEILAAFAGRSLDYFVTGSGTGGTLKGVARVLHERAAGYAHRRLRAGQLADARQRHRPAARRATARPAAATRCSARTRCRAGRRTSSPRLSRDAVADGWSTRSCRSTAREAMRLSRELAQREGIFGGISGGATLAGALRGRAASAGRHERAVHAARHRRALPQHAAVRGHRGRDERRRSSRSRVRRRATASTCQRAAPAPAPVDRATCRRQCRPRAEAFVAATLAIREQPVVMFALEWCEFCWSVRKLFKRARHSLPLDRPRLGRLPERRLGRRHPRGAARAHRRADDPAGVRRRRARRRLHRHVRRVQAGASCRRYCKRTVSTTNGSEGLDPYSLLPKWLHPR